MTPIKKVMMILSGMAFLFSCTKEEVRIDPIENDVEVSFRTTICAPSTRATGTTWEAEDAIGIFALKKGEPLHNDGIYEGMANIEYRNDDPGSTATFRAVSTAIMLPGDGKKLDFVAYYPYTIAITQDYQLPINLTTQSPLSAIDILYATASDQSKHNPHVALTFTHQLSQVVLSLTAADDISLEGISISIENAHTHGAMNLSDGTIELGTTTGTITPVTTVDAVNNEAIVTAILLPGQAMGDLLMKFELEDGSIYYWEPTILALTPSTRYHYALNFIAGDVEMDGDGSIIEDWNDGYTGDPEDLEPSETGDEREIIVQATKTELESTGGSTTLLITVPEGTEWTAISEVDWLTLDTPVPVTRGSQSTQTATGSANIEVIAQPNTNPEPRTGVITVSVEENDYTAVITQAAFVEDDPDPATVATDLFISEYVCGDNDNYYLEIFNGTGKEVDLSNYRVIVYPNAHGLKTDIVELSDILPDKQVVVLSGTGSTLYKGEYLEDNAINFEKGNDAIALEKTVNGGETYTALDIFGNFGKPSEEWTADGGYTTNLKTLRRKPSVRSGVTENPESGFPTLATEWDLYDLNDISGLGEHIME